MVNICQVVFSQLETRVKAFDNVMKHIHDDVVSVSFHHIICDRQCLKQKELENELSDGNPLGVFFFF